VEQIGGLISTQESSYWRGLPCKRPHGSAWNELGDRLWVTCEDRGGVVEVDVASATEVARIEEVCAFPIDFAPDRHRTRGGDLLLACFGSSEITVLDTETRAATSRFPLPAGPLNLEFHPELPVVYASFPRRDQAVEIDIASGEITRTFQAGLEPDGLAIVPPSELLSRGSQDR
jgi:DNA-binding beta-propeller fold protein YncE